MSFEYYVEKAFSQDCVLTVDGSSYNLKSEVSEESIRLKNLNDVADALNYDSRFQKLQSHTPRAF